jgi:hypothetical protein
MIDETSKILAHRAIDGELSDLELKDFEKRLESSTELLQFYSQLRALAELPIQLPSVEVPASLKGEIHNEIADIARRDRARSSNPRSIAATIGTLLTPRLAYGLAAGLVIGIGLSALTIGKNSGQLNPLDVSGTLVGGKDSRGLTRADSDYFGDGQAEGRIAVDVGSGLSYIQVELQSAKEVTVVLEYDPVAYSMRAFEQQSPVSGSIVVSPGQSSASHIGRNHYLFVLGTVGESQAPVVLRVESTGVIYSRELQF